MSVNPYLERLAIEFLQELLGEQIDWTDESLAETPVRFVKMLQEMTRGDIFDFKTFPNKPAMDQMVLVKDIPFVSLCEHHIVPFTGYAHIAYLPDKRIAGLSKFARAVRFWARGLWTQEALTQHIADFLDNQLEPKGVAVLMEAEHMCMTIRGVQVPGTKTVTSKMSGPFLTVPSARHEFLELIRR